MITTVKFVISNKVLETRNMPLPLLPLPLSHAEGDGDDVKDAERERALIAELHALRQKRLRKQLQELQNKRQRSEPSLGEDSWEAPTNANPHHGTVVSINDGEFAVKDDVDSKLWWFPNVKEIIAYRTILGPKLFVKKRAAPHDTVEISSFEADHVSGKPMDPPTLKFDVGTAVTFVPYKFSELLSNVIGQLIMHRIYNGDGTDYPVTVPVGCAGVATQIDHLQIRH